MNSKTKVGVVGVQGLPANYGAFEQTVDQLTAYALSNNPELKFYVGCDSNSQSSEFHRDNVVRIFTKRKKGALVLVYLITTFFKLYFMGVRKYIFFGYSLSPLFWLVSLLGCSIVCNVDGFEWRRAKWGKLAKKYFKFCECCVAHSKATLIFDSLGVERYYNIHFRRTGVLAFYGGVDLADEKSLQSYIDFNTSPEYGLSIMRLEPENNIETIVKAFSVTPQIRLVIVGPETAFFNMKLAGIVSRSPNIDYVGPIYDRSKLNFVRKNAKFYVHGHTVGGTNPTLLEAVAAGNPIIAYRSTFNREVLSNQALYFHDLNSLIQAIKNVSNEGVAPPRLGEAYTWEYVSKQYLGILEC